MAATAATVLVCIGFLLANVLGDHSRTWIRIDKAAGLAEMIQWAPSADGLSGTVTLFSAHGNLPAWMGGDPTMACFAIDVSITGSSAFLGSDYAIWTVGGTLSPGGRLLTLHNTDPNMSSRWASGAYAASAPGDFSNAVAQLTGPAYGQLAPCVTGTLNPDLFHLPTRSRQRQAQASQEPSSVQDAP